MSLVKGLVPGVLLTLIVAAVIGSTGSSGAFLNIHHIYIDSKSFYWSWPLFVTATGLATALYWMTPR
jgi:hypothetical protein